MTILDLTVLGVVGLGGLLGLSRGLTGEILAIIKLLVSAFITAQILHLIDSYLPDSKILNYIVNGVLGGVIFFICSMILSLITFQINMVLSAIVPDIINRPAGAFFGSFKFFLVACVMFYVGYSAYLALDEKEVDWVEDSLSKDTLLATGGTISAVILSYEGIDFSDSDNDGKKEVNIDNINLDSFEGLKNLMDSVGSGDSGDSDDKNSENEETTDSSKSYDSLDELQDSLDLDTGKEIKKGVNNLKKNINNLDALFDSLN